MSPLLLQLPVVTDAVEFEESVEDSTANVLLGDEMLLVVVLVVVAVVISATQVFPDVIGGDWLTLVGDKT